MDWMIYSVKLVILLGEVSSIGSGFNGNFMVIEIMNWL